MDQRLSQFYSTILGLSLRFVSAMSAVSAYAAGPLTIPNSVIQSNVATSGNSFNSLSTEDRRKLLAAPETDAQVNTVNGGLIFKDSSYCNDLQQQIKRAQQAASTAAPDSSRDGPGANRWNQRVNGNVLQYDERSKLEARYHSACNK